MFGAGRGDVEDNTATEPETEAYAFKVSLTELDNINEMTKVPWVPRVPRNMKLETTEVDKDVNWVEEGVIVIFNTGAFEDFAVRIGVTSNGESGRYEML
jgi:hypothetical protein